MLLETVNQTEYNKKSMENTIQITKYIWNAGSDHQVHWACRVILNNKERDSSRAYKVRGGRSQRFEKVGQRVIIFTFLYSLTFDFLLLLQNLIWI